MARENSGRGGLPHDMVVSLFRYRLGGYSIRQTAAIQDLSKTTVQEYAPDWLIAVVRDAMREKNAESP